MRPSSLLEEPVTSEHAPAMTGGQKERAGFRPLFPIFSV
jgi:hypothetical protein